MRYWLLLSRPCVWLSRPCVACFTGISGVSICTCISFWWVYHAVSVFHSIRQHTSAYADVCVRAQHITLFQCCIRQHTYAVSACHHTRMLTYAVKQRAYVSIRQHTSAYVSIRQHTSAYVSIRQHTSTYVSSRCLLYIYIYIYIYV